ncbi:MAG TPA: hypothetical protein VMF35_01345 [Acidimicrobiales bacterium]|nr:hypothetical protein [Acidimicrobiales bacterium]
MADYDQLGSDEQALVRARWDEGMDRRIAELDLRSEYEAARTPYSELDAVGLVVTRHPRTE